MEKDIKKNLRGYLIGARHKLSRSNSSTELKAKYEELLNEYKALKNTADNFSEFGYADFFDFRKEFGNIWIKETVGDFKLNIARMW